MDDQNKMRLRTVIMVVSLVSLPLAAVVGIKWPRWLLPGGSATSSTLASRFRAKTDGDGGKSFESPAAGNARLSVNSGKLSAPSATPSGGYLVQPTANIAVRPDEPVPLRDDPDKAPQGIPPEATATALPLTNDGSLPSTADAEDRSNDPFSQIQHRLRALGATYFSLETWGPQGDMYRFQARMAADPNPNYSRHFEATDTDPLRVMSTVLEEVESWKSGRVP